MSSRGALVIGVVIVVLLAVNMWQVAMLNAAVERLHQTMYGACLEIVELQPTPDPGDAAPTYPDRPC